MQSKPDIIKHQLLVALLQRGFIDFTHPLWLKRNDYREAMAAYFMEIGLELIEDSNNTCLYLAQLTHFPISEGEEPIAVTPLNRSYPLNPSGLALLVVLRQVFDENRTGPDAQPKPCEVKVQEVVQRAEALWQHPVQPACSSVKLTNRLLALTKDIGWLTHHPAKNTLTISPAIQFACGITEISRAKEALKAHLAAGDGNEGEES